MIMKPKKKAKTKEGRDAYLVVCADGEITGKFGQPLVISNEQAITLDIECVCGGPHEIIRMIQVGTGRKALG